MERPEDFDFADFRSMLTKIDGELSKEDLEYLVFLCQSHLNNTAQESIKTGHQLFDVLERKQLISVENVKLLNILFRIIGRMDLIEMLPDNNDMENDSGGEMMTSVDEYVCPFSRVLFYINEELPQDEVERLRYAYGLVPRNVQISSGLDLFKIMKKQKAISSENLDNLKDLLKTIDRIDLVTLIEDFSSQGSGSCVSSISLGAGDTTSVNASTKSPNYQNAKQTSPASKQSCQAVNPISQSNAKSFVRQEQVKPVIPVAPLRPGVAPLFLAQASPDDHHIGPLRPGAAPLSLAQASPDDHRIGPLRPGVAPLSLAQASPDDHRIGPLRSEAAPLSLVQASPDDPRIGPLRPETAPFSLAQTSSNDQNTAQTSVKSLYPSRNGSEAEFSQRVLMEPSSVVETAQEFKIRSFTSSKSMSVPSGTPYNHSVSSGLPWMNSPSHENYTASTGEAAQVTEEINQTDNIPSDRYKMTAEPRGICLVIDIDKFEAHPGAEMLRPRRGSEIDAENLKQCFEMLKFKVQIWKNLTLEGTRNCLEGLSKFNHGSMDCFVCCILSHGCEGAVYCSDSLKMEVKELTSYFSPKRCPSLGGKPKLFFLSCCQGKTKPDAVFHPEAVQLERDGPPSETDQVSSEVADFLIGYATLFGYASFRDIYKGTIYVQILTDILRKHYKK